LPAIVFWLTDAYYLALERRFRDIFRTACQDGHHRNFDFEHKLEGKHVLDAPKSPNLYGEKVRCYDLLPVLGEKLLSRLFSEFAPTQVRCRYASMMLAIVPFATS